MQPLKTPVGGPLPFYDVDPETRLWSVSRRGGMNSVLYGGADIQARLLAGQTNYVIAAMYFEFTNNSSAAPTITRDAGQSYYDGLDGVNYDFIRVPLVTTPLLEASGGDYVANLVRFFGVTADTVGYHGMTFSQGAGSEVIGVALAATPGSTFADDVVFSREYEATAVPKTANAEFGIQWPVQFD